MTCLEKFKIEHDGKEPDIADQCPNTSGGIDIEDPTYCNFGRDNECAMCWNREIPGTETDPTFIMGDIDGGMAVTNKGYEFWKDGEKKIAFEQPAVKDSGERRQFSTGAVRDMAEGKGDMVSIPWEAILRLSRHYEAGAKKYNRFNFRKGIPVSSFIDSACRHLAKYQCGCDDEDHLAAAAFNVLGAMLMENAMPEMQDLPLREGKNTFDYFTEEN